jgi:hypothetical protein
LRKRGAWIWISTEGNPPDILIDDGVPLPDPLVVMSLWYLLGGRALARGWQDQAGGAGAGTILFALAAKHPLR